MTTSRLPLQNAPKTVCLLRLSALGDITHTLPVFYTIKKAWPDTKITWIISKAEYEMVKDIAGVEFIIFDKKAGLAGYQAVNKQLNNRSFDVLLHMQMSLRSSLVSLLVKSEIKLGFDKQRAKDMQWLFTNHKIAPKTREHVIDSFFGFTEALGIKEKVYQWDIPVPEQAREFAAQYIKEQPTLVISPCSSKAYRNWSCEGYAAIADYAITEHDMQIILSGGPSAIEKEYGQCIENNSQHQLTNLIGKTTIKELLAILDKATVVIAPDSGPAHFCTAVDTPVIGLYACTNPDRARPYNSEKWLINRYPDAISRKYSKSIDDLPWGTRVRDEGTMALITIDDVKHMLDTFMAQ